MITIQEIQERLIQSIKESGLKQVKIAELLGLSYTTVNNFMRLKNLPALDTFANLCKILDVSSDEILGLK